MKNMKSARTALITAALALSLTGTLVAPASAHSVPVSTVSTEKVAPAAKKKAKTVSLRVAVGKKATVKDGKLFASIKMKSSAKVKSQFRSPVLVTTTVIVKRGKRTYKSEPVMTGFKSVRGSGYTAVEIPVKNLRKSDRVVMRVAVMGFEHSGIVLNPTKGKTVKGTLKDGTRVKFASVKNTRVHVR